MPYDISFLLSGSVLGLTAGLSPGPTQTFLISQTLQHGIKEGLKVSLVPLMTDVPICLFAVLVLSQLAEVDSVMGSISLIGALFLLYLAYGNFRITGTQTDEQVENPGSIKKGVMTNFLNPYPYMFWLLVGAPMMLKAYQNNIATAGSFVGSFYCGLIGTMAAMAAIVGKSRTFVRGKAYIYAIRGLGIALLIFALRFLWEAWKFFQ